MAGWAAWYRRDFTIPKNAFSKYVAAAARYWVIQFESVNYTATVWLNGHELGSHTGAYLPFEFQLKYLKAGVNRLIVRVDNQRTATSFPHAGNLWWNYGGILDAVYLIPVQSAEIQQEMIRPILKCPTCSATIDESATIHNGTSQKQTVTLSGAYGSAKLDFGTATIRAGQSWTATASVTIAHPKLWAPGSPNLYKATLKLGDSKGRSLDSYQYLSGVREITVTNGIVEVNGRRLNLRGVNDHEQDLSTGEALTLAQMQQIISWVQQLHGTIIRAHYPLNPELEQMADEDGIMLWSEIPVYQTPETYLSQASYRAAAVKLLQTDIAANQNHPSILLWSLGNELPTPVPSGEADYIKEAAAAARAADPTRPVGMAISNWPGVACQPAYAPLDVLGINEYFGWFDAGGGTNDDRAGLSSYLDTVRACHPNQGLMITEFGFEGNRDGPVEDRGTYEFQDNSIEYHLGVFATKPYLSAVMYYNLRDFAAKPGWDGSDPFGTPPFVTNGLVDFFGNEKSAFGIVASSYAATQQIAPPAR
jgi:beta-glucuronidase